MTRLDEWYHFYQKFLTDYIKNEPTNKFISRLAEFASQKRGTINGEMAKRNLAIWDMIGLKYDDMLNKYALLENSEFDYIRFKVYTDLAEYYNGKNTPTISVEKSQYYWNKAMELYHSDFFQSDIERMMCETRYWDMKFKLSSDRDKKIEYVENVLAAADNIPEYAKGVKGFAVISYVQFYLNIGKIEEAKGFLEMTIELYKNNSISIVPILQLARLSLAYNNQQTAEDYLSRAQNINDKFGDDFQTNFSASLSILRSEIRERESKFKEAEKLLNDIIINYGDILNPLQIFMHQYRLLNFHLRVFKITKSRNNLTKALDVLKILEKKAEEYPDDVTIQRLTEISWASVNRFGSSTNKAKAIEILEISLEWYPNYLFNVIDLIDIYFEDIQNDYLGDSLDRLKELMERIRYSPYLTSPLTLYNFSKYLILSARFEMFVNENPDRAINLLLDLLKKANEYNNTKLIFELNEEIKSLKEQTTYPTSNHLSLQEKFEKAELQIYLEKALTLIDK